MWFKQKPKHEVVIRVVKAPHFNESSPKYNYTIYLRDLQIDKPVMWKAGRSFNDIKIAEKFAAKIANSAGWKVRTDLTKGSSKSVQEAKIVSQSQETG